MPHICLDALWGRFELGDTIIGSAISTSATFNDLNIVDRYNNITLSQDTVFITLSRCVTVYKCSAQLCRSYCLVIMVL